MDDLDVRANDSREPDTVLFGIRRQFACAPIDACRDGTRFFRILFTFWAIIAIAFTLMQRGCNQGLHDIGRATGGGGGDAPPMVGIEFCVIVLGTSVLFALNVMFRKNLPNSMR